LQVHSVKFGDSVATNANGSDGGGDGGGGDPEEIRKMIETMLRISKDKSLPPQEFQNLANWIKNSKTFPCLSAQQKEFFWKLEKNRIEANMMTQPIPEWQQADRPTQMQNVSCLASNSEQADMQAAADAAKEMMDAEVVAAAERYAKSMRDIRLNMQQKAMQNIDDDIETKRKQHEGELIIMQAKRQKLESDFASDSETKKRKEKEEYDKAMTKIRECREAKEHAEAKAAEDAKRKTEMIAKAKAAEAADAGRSLDEKYKWWTETKMKNVALPAGRPDKAAAVWAESQAKSALDVNSRHNVPPPEIPHKGPPPQPRPHKAAPPLKAGPPKLPAYPPPGMPPVFEPPAPPVPEHDNWDEPKWWRHPFQGSEPHNACNSPSWGGFVGDDTPMENQTSGWPRQKGLPYYKDPRMQIADWTNTGRSDFLIEIYRPSRPSPF